MYVASADSTSFEDFDELKSSERGKPNGTWQHGFGVLPKPTLFFCSKVLN